jgi:hypothetical protein
MTYLKTTFLALAAAFALAGPALAQGEGMSLRDGQAFVIMADGRMMTRPVGDAAMLASMVQKGKPLAAGQIVVMSAGKLYIVDDAKMPNGKFMSEILMSAN